MYIERPFVIFWVALFRAEENVRQLHRAVATNNRELILQKTEEIPKTSWYGNADCKKELDDSVFFPDDAVTSVSLGPT